MSWNGSALSRLHRKLMEEAYLLLRSPAILYEMSGFASTAVVRLDRVAGPYRAILRARGSISEIEQLATRVGVAPLDVCWLTTADVKGGGAST